MTVLRAATRGSPLARWQAEHVAALLRAVDPSVAVELVVVDTQGDRRLDVPIWELGGKGVFAKEVQAAVLDGRADIAVYRGGTWYINRSTSGTAITQFGLIGDVPVPGAYLP